MTTYRSSEIRTEEAEKPLLLNQYRDNQSLINEYYSNELLGIKDEKLEKWFETKIGVWSKKDGE